MSKWKKIPRISRTIPFGYELDPEDNDILLPIPLELEALERAREHIKYFSYREVANWIYSVTGRYISYVGLRKRLEVERTRRQRLSSVKHWADRLEKAKETIRKLEEDSTGASESSNSPDELRVLS